MGPFGHLHAAFTICPIFGYWSNAVATIRGLEYDEVEQGDLAWSSKEGAFDGYLSLSIEQIAVYNGEACISSVYEGFDPNDKLAGILNLTEPA